MKILHQRMTRSCWELGNAGKGSWRIVEARQIILPTRARHHVVQVAQQAVAQAQLPDSGRCRILERAAWWASLSRVRLQGAWGRVLRAFVSRIRSMSHRFTW